MMPFDVNVVPTTNARTACEPVAAGRVTVMPPARFSGMTLPLYASMLAEVMARVADVTEAATASVPEMKPALDFTGPENVVIANGVILAGYGLAVSASVCSGGSLSRPGCRNPSIGYN